jgi:HlyD family secretion protein
LKRALVIAGIVAALGLIVFASVRGGSSSKGTRVYGEAVARRDISRLVKASGQIDPRLKVNISAHVVGKIQKLYVKEGDAIAAGQPFLDLERDIFVALRDASAAQLEIQRSRLRQAEFALRDSEIKFERARGLRDQGIASKETYEAAELQLNSARQGLEQGKEGVTQAAADLKKAQEDLTKTTIYAPLAGRVIALNAKEGEVVVSGTMNNPASVIGTIADLSEILVEVDVDETEVVYVEVGQSAKVQVDALPEHPYTGRAVEIGSSGFSKPAQPDVTFFKVKVLLDAPDAALRPGMSARAEILTATSKAALVIPIQAVVERKPLAAAQKDGAAAGAAPATDEEIKVVFVVEQGKARQRPVAIGLTDETSAEVTQGLDEGATVVTGPYRAVKKLKDGDAVKVTKESEERDRQSEAKPTVEAD